MQVHCLIYTDIIIVECWTLRWWINILHLRLNKTTNGGKDIFTDSSDLHGNNCTRFSFKMETSTKWRLSCASFEYLWTSILWRLSAHIRREERKTTKTCVGATMYISLTLAGRMEKSFTFRTYALWQKRLRGKKWRTKKQTWENRNVQG